VSQVQIGSQGNQVVIVQDSMNRLQSAQPGAAFASLPLTLDGRFGPKTDARVKEFQGRNNMTPDGVVGPMTRAAIKSQAARLEATRQAA
jgi:peptidoglycan hydrolase-like protein with peptidoglycan-binding domain